MQDDVFFAAEMAAESAAQRTVDSLYNRAAASSSNSAAGVTAVVAVVSIAAIGLWVSPLGVKARKKIAAAIAPKS